MSINVWYDRVNDQALNSHTFCHYAEDLQILPIQEGTNTLYCCDPNGADGSYLCNVTVAAMGSQDSALFSDNYYLDINNSDPLFTLTGDISAEKGMWTLTFEQCYNNGSGTCSPSDSSTETVQFIIRDPCNEVLVTSAPIATSSGQFKDATFKELIRGSVSTWSFSRTAIDAVLQYGTLTDHTAYVSYTIVDAVSECSKPQYELSRISYTDLNGSTSTDTSVTLPPAFRLESNDGLNTSFIFEPTFDTPLGEYIVKLSLTNSLSQNLIDTSAIQYTFNVQDGCRPNDFSFDSNAPTTTGIQGSTQADWGLLVDNLEWFPTTVDGMAQTCFDLEGKLGFKMISLVLDSSGNQSVFDNTVYGGQVGTQVGADTPNMPFSMSGTSMTFQPLAKDEPGQYGIELRWYYKNIDNIDGGGTGCTDNSGTDANGDDCSQYDRNKCGGADSNVFVSSSDCCACGGGTTAALLTTCDNTDTLPIPVLVDTNGDSCSSYTSVDCENDTDVPGGFQAKHHCCACGGGTKYDTLQEDKAYLVIDAVVFTVESPSLPDIILLVGENPATIDFCAESLLATGQSNCGSLSAYTLIDAQVLTGETTPDMTRFNAQTSPSTLIPTYNKMTEDARWLDSTTVNGSLLEDTFTDSDALNLYGWWTISFTYCSAPLNCQQQVSRKLLLFNPCRALVYTKDTTSLFFTDGYIADYEDYAANVISPGTFLITDQMTDNKADIYWTQFEAESNACPPFTVTRTISDKYIDPDGVLVQMDSSTLVSLENMFTITTITAGAGAGDFYNFDYVQHDHPLGTFAVATTITQATLAASVPNIIPFNIIFRDSCKLTNMLILDTEPEQTLGTNRQIGYWDQTTLEWAMIDTTNIYAQMANLQVTRSRPSYTGDCPSTLKIRLTLDSAIDSNGADLVVNAGFQESGTESDWPTDEPNMPVRIQGGNIVFQPKTTDQVGIYKYTFAHIQYESQLNVKQSDFQYQYQLVFEVQEEDQSTYPGTQGAELTCEGYDITELMCTQMAECCHWDLGKCHSSVDQNECTLTSSTAVWNTAKDDFTEQLSQFLVTVADNSPHEVTLAVVGYINEQRADFPDLALTFDLKSASEFASYTTTSTQGVLSLNPTAVHASLTHYFIVGTLTNGEETYELTMNIQVNEGEASTEVEASQEEPEDPCQEELCQPVEEEEQPECIDTAGEATDVNGYGCELRDQDASYCALDDDEDFFISQSMCCSCHDQAVAGDYEVPTETESEEHIEELLEQMQDATPEQRQAVLDELLEYNMEYLTALYAQRSENNGEVEIPEPGLTSTNANSQGKFAVVFNAELLGPSIIQALDGHLNGEGLALDNSQTSRRLLNESESVTNASNVTDASEEDLSFDLSSYLLFELVRGSENSAPLSQLNFRVDSTSIEGSILHFKANFDSPLDVSIGDEKDKLIISVNDTTFFSNRITGSHIAEGSETSIILPKMLANGEMSAIMDVTQLAVEKAGQTILVAQLIITAFLAISLKSMWNLMNVIQVLAYMRFFTDWPAPMIDLFTYMDNAITLKPLSDLFFNLGQDQFEIASQKLSDEALRNAGVQDVQLFKSLGVFTLIIVILLIGVLFFFILKLCKGEKVTKIKDKLHAKLFFNGFLRYMTVSNLKLNYTVWGFMIVYLKSQNLVQAGVCGLILYLIALYPGFMAIGLLRNHHRIEEKKFKTAFNALFNGINTHSKQALVYEAIFCIRRFFIVAVNILLSSKVPLNNFEKPRYLYKILIFIGIQSVYLLYINDTRPHTNNIFNRLEFFNEGSLMLLAYLMIGYSDVMPYNTSGSLLGGIMSVIVVLLIAFANLFVLGYLTFVKLKERFKNGKVKKHSADATVLGLKNQPNQNGSSTLTVVQEQSEEEKEDCKVEDYKQDSEASVHKDPLAVVAKMIQRSELYQEQRRQVLEMRKKAKLEGGIVSSEANGFGKLRKMEAEHKEQRRREKQESRANRALEDDLIELNLKKRRTLAQVETQRELIGHEMADGMNTQIERQYTKRLKGIAYEHGLIEKTGVNPDQTPLEQRQAILSRQKGKTRNYSSSSSSD